MTSMKKSPRAMRMQRRLARARTSTKLNLVSLMDIFTILVFFLLVNSDDVEVLQRDNAITLPQSTSEQRPDNTLVVSISDQSILVDGRPVARVQESIDAEGTTILGLENELKYQAQRAGPLTEEQKERGRAVTVMGDSSVPYALVEKILNTCAAAEYLNISLAVTRRTQEQLEAPAASSGG